MKSVLLFLGVLLLSVGIASAVSCFADPNYLTLVGGSTPNSAIGYGAVDICGECYVCGANDGVCPEDFYSTSSNKQGSCRNAPDPDCLVEISGIVSTSGIPIPGADIVIRIGDEIRTVGTSDDDGYFTVQVPSGLIKLSAFFQSITSAFEDYDSDVLDLEVVRGNPLTGITIEMQKGSCTSQCTGSFGKTCKAACQGVNSCEFTNPSAFAASLQVPALNSYDSSYIASQCDRLPVGTSLTLYKNATHIVYADCCTGTPYVEKRPELTSLDSSGNECIDDLGTHIIKTRYKGQSVKVVVKSWKSSNC